MNFTDRKKHAEELIKQDRYPDALIEFSIIFKENPNDKDVVDRIKFLFKRINDGNYDFDPSTAEQFVMRGISKFYNHEIDNSILDYNKALDLDSNYHYALKCRAFSLKTKGNIKDAISDLRKAIDIEPTGEYYSDISELYSLIGDLKSALKYHELAIKNSPDDPRLWYNYGVDLFESRNLEEALNKFNKAIELWSNYEDAIVNRQHILNILKR